MAAPARALLVADAMISLSLQSLLFEDAPCRVRVPVGAEIALHAHEFCSRYGTPVVAIASDQTTAAHTQITVTDDTPAYSAPRAHSTEPPLSSRPVPVRRDVDSHAECDTCSADSDCSEVTDQHWALLLSNVKPIGADIESHSSQCGVCMTYTFTVLSPGKVTLHADVRGPTCATDTTRVVVTIHAVSL